MDKVRIAIVGCGTISQLNVPGYLRHEHCEVTVLCDPNRERAQRRARQWDITPRIVTEYDDVLNDSQIDAIELLTPTFMHPEQIIAGLDAGKHVSCQKPIATTIAETDQISAAVDRAGTKFRTTENFLHYPPIVKAKELLDAGVIGEPTMLRVRTVRANHKDDVDFQVEPDALAWRRDADVNAGGLLYDDGWHKYATAIWWLGDIEKVVSMVTKTDDFLVETPSAAIFKFKERNCLGVFEYSSADEMQIRSKYYPADEFFEIQGSKGSIWVTRCTGEMVDLPPVMVIKGTSTEGIQVPMDWIEGFNRSAGHFIDCILGDEQPNMDIDFSRHTLQVALSIYQASEKERPVDPGSLV